MEQTPVWPANRILIHHFPLGINQTDLTVPELERHYSSSKYFTTKDGELVVSPTPEQQGRLNENQFYHLNSPVDHWPEYIKPMIHQAGGAERIIRVQPLSPVELSLAQKVSITPKEPAFPGPLPDPAPTRKHPSITPDKTA